MSSPTPPRPRILIAEDEEALRDALQEVLEQDGYEVVGSTGDPAVAVELARELEPDLVLLDYRMPGADGIWLASTILESRPGTQIVMHTFHDEVSLRMDADRVGIFGLVPKGSPTSLILETLAKAWEHKRKQDLG